MGEAAYEGITARIASQVNLIFTLNCMNIMRLATVLSTPWTPVIGETNKEKYTILINKIARGLIDSPKEERVMGITQGRTGISIFFHYAARLLQNEEYKTYADNLLESCIDSISNEHNKYNFADGIAGFGWAISNLARTGYIENNVDEFLEDIDPFLSDCVEHDKKRENIDFFWGASGLALYFIERGHMVKNQIILKDYLDYLQTQYCDPTKEKNWGEREATNLTFAHGIPAILSGLVNMIEKGIHVDQATHILKDGIRFILSTQLNDPDVHSIFGDILIEGVKPQPSRLAWCQGDMMMGLLLLRAGIVLQDKTIENKGLEVTLDASRRRERKVTDVVDASICHGTAGNAHIFNRIYHYTGRSEFKETTQFWLEGTLDLARPKGNIVEYHPLKGGEKVAFRKDESLTMGSSGVGLALIAGISDLNPAWDASLLLSM